MEGVVAIVSVILIVIGIILIAVCLWKFYYSKRPNDGMMQFFNSSRSPSISSVRKPSVQLARSRSRSPHTLKTSANGNHQLLKAEPQPDFTVTVVPDNLHLAEAVRQPQQSPLEIISPPKVERGKSERLPLTDVCLNPPMAEPPPVLNDSIILPNANGALIEPLHPTRTKPYLPESIVLINQGIPPYPLATASRTPIAVFYRPAQGLPPPTYSQAMHGRPSPTAGEANKEEFTEFQSYR